jgi:hypothetical protein
MAPRPAGIAALAVGAAALVAIGAGTGAVAATQITGAQIKDNTVTSADVKDETLKSVDIKNRTIRKGDLSDGVLTDLVARVAMPGQTQVGTYSAWGGGTQYVGDSVTFRSTLPVEIPGNRITFVRDNAFTSECPSVGTVVPNAWVCIYEGGYSATALGQVYRPDVQGSGVRPVGFGIYFDCSSANCWSFGTYAVKAGAAADISVAPRGSKQATPG